MWPSDKKVWIPCSPTGGIQQALETAAKSVTPYKRLDTGLYFIITNFHRDKTQVKANHDMNSPAFTSCTTFA